MNHFLLLIILKSLNQSHKAYCQFRIWDHRLFPGRTEIVGSVTPWSCLVVSQCTFPLLPLLSPLLVIPSAAMPNDVRPPSPALGLTILLFIFFLWGPARTQNYRSSFTCQTFSLLNLSLIFGLTGADGELLYCPFMCVCVFSLTDFELLEGSAHLIQLYIPGAWCLRCCRL